MYEVVNWMLGLVMALMLALCTIGVGILASQLPADTTEIKKQDRLPVACQEVGQ